MPIGSHVPAPVVKSVPLAAATVGKSQSAGPVVASQSQPAKKAAQVQAESKSKSQQQQHQAVAEQPSEIGDIRKQRETEHERAIGILSREEGMIAQFRAEVSESEKVLARKLADNKSYPRLISRRAI